MRELPPSILSGVFTPSDAADLGVSRRMLQGQRFVRVFPRVYRHRDHVLTTADWVRAAGLTLPEGAATTGLTRIQQLGLDHGPLHPMHFVLDRDHHHDVRGIYLHRTVSMPPLDDVGATPAAAFLSLCRFTTVLHAVRVGCWLLHHGHTTREELASLVLDQPWRDGAQEVAWLMPLLDHRCRSLPEAEVMAVLFAAGLTAAEPNVEMRLGDLLVMGDLVYELGLVVEYEGTHHQLDRGQYVRDIDRYALFRDHDVPYLQVTKERLRQRRVLVGEVYRRLLALGYDGPPPELTGTFALLDHPLHEVAARISRGPGWRRRAA